MRRLQIHGYLRKSQYPSRPGTEHDVHPNLLNREFHASKPLQKVASDITYIKYGGKWFFLVCYLDLFNNEIVEWQLSDSLDNFFVIQSAKRLLEKAECTGYPILLHSDQGNQYTAIKPCLEIITPPRVCQEPGPPETTPLWRVSSDVSRMCYVFSSAIGSPVICTLSFLTQFTILIPFVPFASSMGSHPSNLESNRWLDRLFVSINY